MAGESTNTLWNWWLAGQLPVNGSGQIVPPAAGSGIGNKYSVNSVAVTGTVAAPAADTVVAATGNLTGLYEINVTVNVSGTGTFAAGDVNNMAFNAGGQVTHAIINSTKDFPSQMNKVIARLTAQPIQVKSVGAASANLNYYANIVATKIGD